MTIITARHFSAVEYIKKLREAKFSEEQAEIVVEIIEQQSQVIQEQSTKITQLENKELATKSDILKSEIRIMLLMAAGFVSMFGILAKGFHWI